MSHDGRFEVVAQPHLNFCICGSTAVTNTLYVQNDIFTYKFMWLILLPLELIKHTEILARVDSYTSTIHNYHVERKECGKCRSHYTTLKTFILISYSLYKNK